MTAARSDRARKRTVVFLGADASYMFAFRRDLMLKIQQRGYRVVVVATALPGFKLADYDIEQVEFHHWPVEKAGMNLLSDLASIAFLFKLLRQHSPAVLFAHTIKPIIFGIPVAWLLGVPRRTAMIPGLGYAFGKTTRSKNGLVTAVASMGYRLALGRSHVAIFQNSEDAKTLAAFGALPRTTPVAVVNGSGVDTERFVAVPIPAGPSTFLMASRLLKEKGVYEFAEAARIVKRALPTARFVLAGAPDTNPSAVPQSAIDQWVTEGLIEARGHVKDVQPELAACSVFVLPSYYSEGCPRSNLEAMASGRPIITTDWVGCRDTVVHDLNGILVPPRDVDALASAMLSLAQDSEKMRKMGEESRRLCLEKYELRRVTNETVSLILGE